MRALSLVASLGLFASACLAGEYVDAPDTGAFLPAQAAADALRDFASADGAFIGADQLKATYAKDNLASLLRDPVDTVVVMNLTGAQIKKAFEFSLSLFPEPNSSFLQLSGFEVTFSKSAPANARVVRITANGAPLEDKRTYAVAMPFMLGNGVLGYFKIWDKSQIAKKFDKTIESVLSKKPYAVTSPRWLPQ